MQRVLQAAAQNPLMIPTDLMAYILDYVQTSRLIIPIGQVFGFTNFTAFFDDVSTQESTTSATATDLATVGPTITGLPDGTYVVLFGASCRNTTGSAEAYLVIDGNVTGDPCKAGANTEFFSASRHVAVTFTGGGSHTLSMKYRQNGGGTAEFYGRELIALRSAKA